MSGLQFHDGFEPYYAGRNAEWRAKRRTSLAQPRWRNVSDSQRDEDSAGSDKRDAEPVRETKPLA